MNIDEKHRLVASLPRPRAVQLSRRGKSWVLILSGVLAAVEIGLLTYVIYHWMATGSFSAVIAKNPAAFYLALGLPFLTVMFSGGLRKQKELLRNGDVALATVTSTSNSPSQPNRNDDVRTVQYEFRDATGTVLTGSSADPTLLLREGSAMLVYYDSDDLSQQIAQCAAYYKVVAPGLDSNWLDEMG
jgi:hypothetical protein